MLHAWGWNPSNAPATDEQWLAGVVCFAVCGRCHLDQPGLIKHKYSTRLNGSIGNQIQKKRQRLIQLVSEIRRIMASSNSKAHGIPRCKLLHFSALCPVDSIQGRRQQRRRDGLSLNQAQNRGKAEAFNAWARRSVASMVRAISISASEMPYFAGNN